MAEKPVVLVVESEQREAHALASALRDARWRIVPAIDAASAIKAARELTPAVVVLTGRVLGGGGLVALKHLRNSVHTAAIPVVGVCGSGLQEAFLSAGVQECFAERTPASDLAAAVAYHMSHRPVVREASEQVIRDPGRLAALRRTQLLDSAPEESFDRVTRLATRLLDVPTALISLVDSDRQFFKSHVGLGEPWATRRETPLSHSFCQWAVASGENLIVSNARANEVLRENRAVDELGVNAYAGALLKAPEGDAIGTVCAIDSNERKWSADDLTTLMDLRDVAQGYIFARSGEGADSIRAAVSAATRLLVRPNTKFGETERAELVATIDELSRALYG